MEPGLCQPLDRTPSFKRVVAFVVELVDKCDDGRSSSRRTLTKLRVCSLPALRWVLWPDACFQSCAPRLGDRQDLFAIVNYLTLFGNWASALFNDIEQNPMTGDRTT